MTGTPDVQPASLAIQTPPGTSATGTVTIDDPPADPAVRATVSGTGLTLSSIGVTTSVWYEYTDQDILDLPESQRAAARKAHGYWTPSTTDVDVTVPVVVPAKASIAVTVAVSSAVPGITVGTLTLTGATWGVVEVPVLAVVGTQGAHAVSSFDPVGLLCQPGDNPTPSVTIQAPPPTSALARLAAGGDPAISIGQVTVLMPQRHEWDPDELLDLPESMREQAKKDGWIDWHPYANGGADTVFEVPAKGIVEVMLAIAVPAQNPPDELTATLQLYATGWQTSEIPIRVVVSDFAAVPLTDRVFVPQGGTSAPFGVALSSTFGPAADVQFTVADAEPADVRVDPGVASLAAGAKSTVPLTASLAANASLGAYPVWLGRSYDVGLRVSAFGGLYQTRFPLGLTALPGHVTVTAVQGSIEALQGSTVDVPLSITVDGGVKQVTFSGVALPVGVSISAPEHTMQGPSTDTVALSVTIAPDTPAGNVMIAIAWTAGDEANSGVLSLPLVVDVRPESRTFAADVVTSSGALNGHLSLTLDNSGHGTFSGSMRATGFASYTFQVRIIVRSADGLTAIVAQQSGEVRGTDTPGDREVTWTEPIDAAAVAMQWPAFRTASVAISEAHELSGTLGTAEDIAVAFLEYLAATALFAVTGGLSLVIYAGAELGAVTGAQPAGAAGLAGVIVTGGLVFLLGPSMLIPVLVASTVIGDATIRSHRLREDELALLTPVFGSKIPADRVLITDMSSIHGTKFTVPDPLSDDILVNLGDAYDDTVGHTEPNYPHAGQLLIHEMTHAWQIAYVYGTVQYYGEAFFAKIHGNASYYYTPAGPPFRRFGLEQQASIVDEWAGGTTMFAIGGTLTGRDAEHLELVTDPYYPYIINNIQMGLL